MAVLLCMVRLKPEHYVTTTRHSNSHLNDPMSAILKSSFINA